MNAPRLVGLQTWYIERQLKYYQQGIRGAHKDDTFGQQMAPMAGMLANETAIRNVTAYIDTLTAAPGIPTIEGDIERGANLYVTCGACHGASAEGKYALNAPRLAGQSDWYLKRQLENFQRSIRGAHKSDSFGHQMVLMSKTLQNEQAVNDLLAYLNNL